MGELGLLKPGQNIFRRARLFCRDKHFARRRPNVILPAPISVRQKNRAISDEFGDVKNWRGPGGFPAEPPLTYQPTCKPGSVRPAAHAANVTAILLLRRLPGASSNLPERLARTDPRLAPQRRSYSVLLPVGFAVPFPSLETRCALTAPFHPYRGQNATQPRRSVLCGTVPEAYPRLRGNTPRRTLSGTVRPWSPDFPPRPPFGIGAERPSGRLTGIAMGLRGRRVKTACPRAFKSVKSALCQRRRPRLQQRAQRQYGGSVGDAVDPGRAEMALECDDHAARGLVVTAGLLDAVAVAAQHAL